MTTRDTFQLPSWLRTWSVFLRCRYTHSFTLHTHAHNIHPCTFSVFFFHDGSMIIVVLRLWFDVIMKWTKCLFNVSFFFFFFFFSSYGQIMNDCGRESACWKREIVWHNSHMNWPKVPNGVWNLKPVSGLCIMNVLIRDNRQKHGSDTSLLLGVSLKHD